MAEKLDIVVFGATGFTGKYAVRSIHKMAKESEKPISWAIAGRSETKLKEVLEYCKEKTGDDVSNIKIILADIKDEESIKKMTAQARVIVNCCGPYRFFGEPVVKACIETGTHHVDVSGEPQYIERMQLEYNKAAAEKGIYIVSACGFDSVPADLGVMYLQQNFEGTINSVETYLTTEPKYMDSGARVHYGTWESAIYGLAHYNELRPLRTKLYPERLPEFKPKLGPRGVIHRNTDVNDNWYLPFLGTDKSVMNRSQRFLYDHDKKRPIQVQTYFGVPTFFAVIAMGLFGLLFTILCKFSVGRTLLLKYPRFFSGGYFSHEGPSEKYCENLDFAITFYGKGWAKSENLSEPTDQFSEAPNKTVVTRVSGTDPAYAATAAILVLCGLTILNEADKMPDNGGVLPPGAAFANTCMIENLQKKNILKFEVLSTKEEK